jgi:glycosyltransferase involved in cell wall biosynthesis
LLRELRALGVPARRASLAEAHAVAARGRDDLWVDSLYLEAVPDLARHAPGRVHLCLHYLPSLVEYGAAWTPAVLGRVEHAALREARSILVPSAWLGRVLEQTGALSGRFFVVEPGVELRVTLSPPPPPVASQGPLRVVMTANVVPGKGVLPFLLALDREIGESPFTLTIVGGLDAAPAYAASCRDAALARPSLARAVRFAGSLSPSATQETLAGADVLLSASRMESYGMALAEARALGVPIVARKGGNAAAHVSARAGGAAFDDDDALAREIVFLAARRDEVDARRRRAWEFRRVRAWGDAARDFVAGASLTA